MSFSPVLQQPIDQIDSTILWISLLISTILTIVVIIIYWTIYEKAGKPGWAAIVPIYNLIVFLDIVERPRWWFVLLLIPLVSIVVGLIVMFDLARVFGKGPGFAIGLILLSPLFLLILAFDSSQYIGSGTAVTSLTQ